MQIRLECLYLSTADGYVYSAINMLIFYFLFAFLLHPIMAKTQVEFHGEFTPQKYTFHR